MSGSQSAVAVGARTRTGTYSHGEGRTTDFGLMNRRCGVRAAQLDSELGSVRARRAE